MPVDSRITIYGVKKLITSSKTGDWCKIPYPGHPKGCPNYGKSFRCPPAAPKINEFFDLSKPIYIVNSEFDLAAHARRMKENHPAWSERQCECVLYWQSTNRKRLKNLVKFMMKEYGPNTVTYCPEAMGVNVYATSHLSGLYLERIKSLSICRHIAFIGYRKEK